MKKATINHSALSRGFAGIWAKYKGIIGKIPLYFMLTAIALLYIEPVFYMISMSFKSTSDIIDPTTKWFPKNATLVNMEYAFKQMSIGTTFLPNRSVWDSLMRSTLFVSVLTTFPPALLQVLTCGIAGYAFARLSFPFKKLLTVLLVFSYIVPPQTIAIPYAWVLRALGIVNSPLAFIIPAIFAGGIKGSLFIIIYMQFFRKIPKELEEAAYIDGANRVGIFFKVMFPLAKPAMITVFLFSMVWHWNESFLTSLIYTRVNTLGTQIKALEKSIETVPYDYSIQPVKMACALLFMAPMLVIYFFTQKHFTQSIERTGLVE